MKLNLREENEYKFPIMLFDGECNFCNASIATIVRHEYTSMIRFASLQSEFAQELLGNQFEKEIPDSLVVIIDNKIYFYADAIFAIKQHLKWYFRIPLHCLELFKGKFADYCYKQIAKRRHSIIKKEVCFVPDPCLRRRFL